MDTLLILAQVAQDTAQAAQDTAQATDAFASLGIAKAFACLGAAFGVGLVGMKAAEAVGRNPGAFGRILVIGILGMALAEAIAFYGLFLS